MDVSEYIARRIRECRKERGLTQKELGRLVGVKDNTISGYEHNINDPGNDMLFKIAHALHISINDLFPSTTKPERALSGAEQEHLEKYRALSKEHQEAIDVQLDFFYKKDTTIEVTIPVDETGERAALLRRIDEELEKEKEGQRASSFGRSARVRR